MPSLLVIAAVITAFSCSKAAMASGFRFRQMAVEFGYGAGIESTKLLRLNLQWNYLPRLSSFRGMELVGIAQVGGGMWRGDRDIADVSFTPIFRLQGSSSDASIRPYFEAAIGFHYISEIQMRHRVFSTNFQFGDHLGIGVLFGRGRTVEVAYLFQHLSNASIKRPNSGINFHILRIGYSL